MERNARDGRKRNGTQRAGWNATRGMERNARDAPRGEPLCTGLRVAQTASPSTKNVATRSEPLCGRASGGANHVAERASDDGRMPAGGRLRTPERTDAPWQLPLTD